MGPGTEDQAQRTLGGGLSVGHRQTENVNVILLRIWERYGFHAGCIEKIGEHF